jgi:hypothetical protein
MSKLNPLTQDSASNICAITILTMIYRHEFAVKKQQDTERQNSDA